MYTQHIPTAQAGAAYILAWEENTVLFDPLQLQNERGTVEGCFKLSQKEKHSENKDHVLFNF